MSYFCLDRQEGEWDGYRQEEDKARRQQLTNEDVAAMRQRLIDAETCARHTWPLWMSAMRRILSASLQSMWSAIWSAGSADLHPGASSACNSTLPRKRCRDEFALAHDTGDCSR